MALYFSKSQAVFDTDSSPRPTLLFILITGFLALWSTWLVIGRVAVFASTTSGRLEVDRENHPVDATVAGRVVAFHASVGQAVKTGDVLIEIDATPEQLARTEEQARLAPAASQIGAMREELKAQERALEGDRRANQAALAQAQAEQRRARTAAASADQEWNRIQELQKRKLVSELDADRTRNAATEKQNQAESAAFASQALMESTEAKEQERLAQIARLKRDIAEMQGTRAEAAAASDRLRYDIEQRTVRAPVDGTIAEVMQVRAGRVLAAGTRICTIVPSGDLRIVALYPPAVALGRIREGQSARVRLEGFPWTQYGSPTARVTSVAGEAHDGTIRVELTLESRTPDIPLQHGLPAEVDVEIERVSPLALVLRTIGAQTRLAAAPR
jgi:multidrug resistance efflux pump